MSVQFKILITKEILEKSKFCSSNDKANQVTGENCAIAIALKDLFPNAYISNYSVSPFGRNTKKYGENLEILLPPIAQHFIKLFDSLRAVPKLRLLLPEFDFEISIPDELIAKINIEEMRAIANWKQPPSPGSE